MMVVLMSCRQAVFCIGNGNIHDIVEDVPHDVSLRKIPAYICIQDFLILS